jgi:DNA polymerase-3 subunit alpha
MSDLVHLHCHSEYSYQDGMAHIDRTELSLGHDPPPARGTLAMRAKELGMKALAITDHGSLGGYYRFYKECKQLDIKPIIGCEVYIVPDMHKKEKQESGKRDYDHLTILAKSNQGLQNLFRLHWLASDQGFYYKPRTDYRTLIAHKQGLIVLSGCLSAAIPRRILAGQYQQAVAMAARFKEEFGDDFYMEIQPHRLPKQVKVNEGVLRIAQELNIPLVATNDLHYTFRDECVTHEVMLCIQSRDSMANDDRWTFGDNTFYLCDGRELAGWLRKNHGMDKATIEQAIANTLEIADKCTAEIHDKKNVVPSIEIPKDFDDRSEYLRHLLRDGWKRKAVNERIVRLARQRGMTFDELRQVYVDRLEREFALVTGMGFIDYFLVVWDLCRWAHENRIERGPGRGSAAGSLLSYLLDITKLDPIEYDLMFERFISEHRVNMPDIDLDFEDEGRPAVLRYLSEKYGEENVAHVANYAVMKGRLCLKDVARAYDVPIAEVNTMTAYIQNIIGADEDKYKTIRSTFEEFRECKAFARQHPDAIKHAIALEGTIRQPGMHACGMVVAPFPLLDFVPVERRGQTTATRERCTVLTAKEVETIGLLKLDVLGLKTMTVIKRAKEWIRKRHGIDIDFDHITLDDPEVLRQFREGKTVGVFQFEGAGWAQMCQEIGVESFEDLITINALYRPGTMQSGLAAEWVRRRQGEEYDKLHPAYDRVTEKTLGILIYQEQITQCFAELAGYTLADADKVRGSIAKSHGREEIEAHRADFVAGCVKNGVSEEDANTLFDKMLYFGGYAFNRSHSAAYSMLSYWTMYLKTYYPLEFMCALLSIQKDAETMKRYFAEARRLEIEIRPPDINKSHETFAIADDCILAGLSDIKGVGEKIAPEILANAPYADFAEFLGSVNRRRVNRRVIKSLAQCGAFRSCARNSRVLFESLEYLLKDPKKVAERLAGLDWTVPDWTDEEVAQQLQDICPLPLGVHPLEFYADIIDKLKVKLYALGELNWDLSLDGLYWVGVVVDKKAQKYGSWMKEKPTEAQKREMARKGKPYLSKYFDLVVEDMTGNNRVRVFPIPYHEHRELVDSCMGQPCLFFGRSYNRNKTLYAEKMWSIPELRRKLSEGTLDDGEAMLFRTNWNVV